MFICLYLTLYHIAINEASVIMFEGNQLLDATIVAIQSILLSARVTHMHKILRPKVKVVAT